MKKILAVVLAIVALAKDRACKMAIVSLIIGVLAAAYAIIPMLTICSYNCAIDNAQKKLVEEQKNKNDEDDDDFDIDWDF
jgi:cytochrome c oxidase assembly protein Cox11